MRTEYEVSFRKSQDVEQIKMSAQESVSTFRNRRDYETLFRITVVTYTGSIILYCILEYFSHKDAPLILFAIPFMAIGQILALANFILMAIMDHRQQVVSVRIFKWNAFLLLLPLVIYLVMS